MQLLWYLLIIRTSLSYSLDCLQTWHYLWTSSLLFADVSSLIYPKSKVSARTNKAIDGTILECSHSFAPNVFSELCCCTHRIHTTWFFYQLNEFTDKYIRSLPRHTVNGFVNIFRTSQVLCRTKFPFGFSLYSFPLNMVQWTWRYRWWASMTSLLNLVSASSSTNFSKVGVVTMETDSWRWARAARSLMTMIDVAMRMTRKIHGSTVA